MSSFLFDVGQVFPTGSGQVAAGGERGFALVGAFVIPKPVLFSVGENYESGAQVLRVSACLLLGIIGVKVWPFCFQHTKGATFSGEYVIGAPALAIQFKTHSVVMQKIPAAVFERLVDQDARKSFGFGHDRKFEYSSGRRINVSRRDSESLDKRT